MDGMQQDDFDFTGDAYARNTDPETSVIAADEMRTSGKASALEQRVYEALDESGPRTSRELAAITGIDYASLTPRIKPLRKRGMVYILCDDAGNPVRREKQTVWAASAMWTSTVEVDE